MEQRPIHLFLPTYRIEECLSGIRECLEAGWTGLGFKTVEFEEAWKNFTHFENAHFLNSATAGLHLAVKILKESNGWHDGDEVISTPISFVSTNHAILYERLRVVFADIDEFGCLDPASIERLITARTRAVMFVGLGGNTGQLQDVIALCQRRGLALILDAAHMAGTRFNGATAGLDADAVVFSFQAVKNLPTADSGMLCFRASVHDALARRLSWLGIDKDTYSRTNGIGSYKWYYDVEHLGFKYHGNSIMAAIGLAQIKYLDADNSYRRQLCNWYDEWLSREAVVKRVMIAEGCESSRHLYQILLPNRDEVLLALNNANIFPGVHYRDNTEYSMYSNQGNACPNARYFSDSAISLPLHLRMTREDVGYVSATLMSILNSKHAGAGEALLQAV